MFRFETNVDSNVETKSLIVFFNQHQFDMHKKISNILQCFMSDFDELSSLIRKKTGTSKAGAFSRAQMNYLLLIHRFFHVFCSKISGQKKRFPTNDCR